MKKVCSYSRAGPRTQSIVMQCDKLQAQEKRRVRLSQLLEPNWLRTLKTTPAIPTRSEVSLTTVFLGALLAKSHLSVGSGPGRRADTDIRILGKSLDEIRLPPRTSAVDGLLQY